MLSFGVTFAQATLYGNVDQAWNNSTTKQGGVVSSDKTGFAAIQMGGGILGVKGSEDVASGMKASYVIELQPAIDGDSGSWNRQSFVGLSGAFGAVRIGKQYSNAFNNTVGVDPGGATGIAGNASYCVLLAYTKCIGGSDGPLRQANGVQYDLPELVSGLKAGVTMIYGESDTAKGAPNSGTGNGFNLSYSSGALYAGYTFDKVKNTPIGLLTTTGTTVTYTTTPTATPQLTTVNISGTSPDVAAASTTDANKLTTMSASYNLGVAKIGLTMNQGDNGGTTTSTANSSFKSNNWSLTVPLGAFVPFVSTGTAKTTIDSTNVVTEDYKMTQYGARYSLSKRTTAYVMAGTTKNNAAGAAWTKDSKTVVGLAHSF